MTFSDRLELFKQLENLRGRPLIVYVTSARRGAAGEMAKDAVPELLDQLQTLEASTKALDLLLVSDGGDPTVAWSIASLIREQVKEFAVLVPQAAYSAATLIALGADEIVMHPHGNLGPVDPQIRTIRKGEGGQAEQLQFGAEDLSSFLRFTREAVGLTDQNHLAQMFALFCKDVGSVQIGIASRSSQLSIMMGEKLLKMHMKGADQSQQAATIAEPLNKNFFHHGYPVSRSEAKEIGLKIAEENSEVEDLLWRIWSSLEQEFDFRKPFKPLDIVEKSGQASVLFDPVPFVAIPSNLPPQVQEQAYQQILSKIAVHQVETVDYTITHAVMESIRCASRSTTTGKILATRRPDLQITYNVVRVSEEWTKPMTLGRETLP